MRYLSDEWLDAANAALVGATTPVQAVVGFVVTDGPDGDTGYSVCFSDGTIQLDRTSEPDVTLTLRWALAAAIARGKRSAQRAVLDGEIRIGGDVGVLLGNSAALAQVDDRLVDLRAATSYA